MKAIEVISASAAFAAAVVTAHSAAHDAVVVHPILLALRRAVGVTEPVYGDGVGEASAVGHGSPL